MKKVKHFFLLISLLLLTACDVHEWPDTPEYVPFHLQLNYHTNMTEWNNLYDGSNVVEQNIGKTYDNARDYGKIRYVIRAYPILDKQRSSQNYTKEFVIVKNLLDGYDHDVTLELPSGDYNMMVWSDLIESEGDSYFHESANFSEIKLSGDHQGNTDYRDAFRGTGKISLIADIREKLPDTLDITMERPLAKFEVITNDVKEFIEKETARAASKAVQSGKEDVPTRVVNIQDYKVVFYYVGFMPNTSSMNTDKPVDSTTGVIFESTLTKLDDSEATMGFDYLFVNGKESAVTIQIGLYDKEDTQLSLTDPIAIPIKRNHHTILRGMFLMSEASGGVSISPDYEGDHNLIIP